MIVNNWFLYYIVQISSIVLFFYFLSSMYSISIALDKNWLANEYTVQTEIVKFYRCIVIIRLNTVYIWFPKA